MNNDDIIIVKVRISYNCCKQQTATEDILIQHFIESRHCGDYVQWLNKGAKHQRKENEMNETRVVSIKADATTLIRVKNIARSMGVTQRQVWRMGIEKLLEVDEEFQNAISDEIARIQLVKEEAIEKVEELLNFLKKI